ncbi:MAG: Jag family protein [Elusimicrobiota bacterium]
MESRELLARWKELTGWDDLEWSESAGEGGRLNVTLKTSRSPRLMASNGEALEAFEYLFNLILARQNDEPPAVAFDVEGFREPRLARLEEAARSAAREAKQSQRPWRMDPMPPADRRVIHQTLAGDPDVETSSEGDGPFRKVVVRLRQGAGKPAAVPPRASGVRPPRAYPDPDEF